MGSSLPPALRATSPPSGASATSPVPGESVSQREARGLGPLCEGAPPAGGGGESLAIAAHFP